ncbi:hypothetical protein Desku_0729 [Desulfofundulus kuznetsovii DSM 6115]|uniref:HTH marR-type domain-containing protein n=2 Tax=Desulfofundulus kuznetsovii TaxID=58135 RepID=A0AAU8PRS2_DESK7|nr:hypothetical protein Desku_0729 [Desulfofundulus kuznetsovii DSM 6115]
MSERPLPVTADSTSRKTRTVPQPPGFVSEFVEWASGVTDAPLEFLVGAALSCLSVAVGNRSVVNDRIHGNLWLLLIGPSSVARKTTSINLARLLCRKAGLPIFPDRITPESFYESLVSNPEGLFTLAELSGWLGHMNRNYAQGLKSDLTELYDCNHFERMRKTTRGKVVKYVIEKPYICLLTASTQEWLEAVIKEDDSAGGFLPRFHFFLGTSRTEYYIPPRLSVPDELVVHLRRVASVRGQVSIEKDPAVVDAASEYYIRWAQEFNARTNEMTIPHIHSYAERIKTSVFKIALLLDADTCASSGASEFRSWTLPAVQWACAFGDYFLSTAHEVLSRLAFSDFERLARKVLDIISAKKGGITQRDLLRAAKVPKSALSEVIDYLIESELIERHQVVSRGPKTYVYISKL